MADFKFHLNSLFTNEVMPYQSCKSKCVYRTLFINPATYVGGLRTIYCLLFTVKMFHVFCRLPHNCESFSANICV